MSRERVFIVAIFLTLFVFISFAQSQTYVSGRVSGIWTKENSPYIVSDDISIMPDHTLVIKPGVHVYFQDSVEFTIGEEFNTRNEKHQLIAKGTETDSIIFAALNPEKGWWGIKFIESSDDDTIAYAIIKDIKRTGMGIWGYWGEIDDGIIVINFSSPQIYNTSIQNNKMSNFALLNCNNASLKLSNCIIRKNESLLEPGWDSWAINMVQSSIFGGYGSNIRVENTLIYDNHVGQFINNTDGSLFTFINVTISKNVFILSDRSFDVGRLLPKKLYFINSIITNNSTDFTSLFDTPSKGDSILFSYSNIDTSFELRSAWWIWEWGVKYSWKNNPIIKWNTGNISTDPLFTDVENFDFTLQPNSPCVDAGNPHSAYNDNEDPNNPGQALWPARGTVRNDMGAYGGKSALKPTKPTSVVSHESEKLYPEDFALLDNYPNPFNPETIIEYHLPRPEKVTLTVYNALGQQIKTLTNSEHTAGIHHTVWDGRDRFGRPVSSGVYLYRIDAGAFHRVKQMMLLR